jgi:hypothetical protein
LSATLAPLRRHDRTGSFGRETEENNWSASRPETGHSRSGSVNIEDLALLEAELDETLAHVDGAVLDLNKVEPLVLGELEVLPRLLLEDLLAVDHLLDVLLLLDGGDDIAPAEGVAGAVGAGVVEEDVGDGGDALLGALDEGVLVKRVAADRAVGVGGLGDLDGAVRGELVLVHCRVAVSRKREGRGW